MVYCKDNLFILFALAVFTSCSVVPTSKDRSSIGYFTSYNLPLADSGMLSRNDSVLIYRDGNKFVYDLSSIYFKTQVNVNPNTGEGSEEWIDTPQTRHSYFVIDRDSLFGLYYDSLAVTKPKRNPRDSILDYSYLKETPYYFMYKGYQFIGSKVANGVTIETYKNIELQHKNNPDTLLLYFKKGVDFGEWSLSKELDSIKKARLFKGTFIFKSKMKDGKLYPRGEWTLEMRNIPFSKDASYLIRRHPPDMEKL